MSVRGFGVALVGTALVTIAVLTMTSPDLSEEAAVASPAEEAPAAEKLDVASIIAAARQARVARSFDKYGSLRRGAKQIAFDVSVSQADQTIQYSAANPDQVIEVDFSQQPIRVTESLAGGPAVAVGAARLGGFVGDSEINYADLAERFWDWPEPKFLDEEKERVSIGVHRQAWVIRLDNPVQGDGPYGVVKLWVDHETRALLRLDAYNWKGRKTSRYEITKVGKDRETGVWVTEKIRLEKFDHEGEKKRSNSIEFEKPVWNEG